MNTTHTVTIYHSCPGKVATFKIYTHSMREAWHRARRLLHLNNAKTYTHSVDKGKLYLDSTLGSLGNLCIVISRNPCPAPCKGTNLA
jgi:hypothetical protein